MSGTPQGSETTGPPVVASDLVVPSTGPQAAIGGLPPPPAERAAALVLKAREEVEARASNPSTRALGPDKRPQEGRVGTRRSAKPSDEAADDVSARRASVFLQGFADEQGEERKVRSRSPHSSRHEPGRRGQSPHGSRPLVLGTSIPGHRAQGGGRPPPTAARGEEELGVPASERAVLSCLAADYGRFSPTDTMGAIKPRARQWGNISPEFCDANPGSGLANDAIQTRDS